MSANSKKRFVVETPPGRFSHGRPPARPFEAVAGRDPEFFPRSRPTNSPYKTAAIIVNILFGVTLVGWIIALILPSKQAQAPIVVYKTLQPPC